MFNPYLALLTSATHSPKLVASSSNSSVYSLRNLTVFILDLLFSLYRFQGSFAVVLATTLTILAKHFVLVKRFLELFLPLTQNRFSLHFPRKTGWI